MLAGWLVLLPVEQLNTTPWLLYWQANRQLPMTPQASRRDFETVFKQQQVGDADGTLLAWCGIINAIAFEIRPLHLERNSMIIA